MNARGYKVFTSLIKLGCDRENRYSVLKESFKMMSNDQSCKIKFLQATNSLEVQFFLPQ